MSGNELMFSHLGLFIKSQLRCIFKDEHAVTAVEYALIVGIMAAALVAAVPSIAPGINGIFNHVSSEL